MSKKLLLGVCVLLLLIPLATISAGGEKEASAGAAAAPAQTYKLRLATVVNRPHAWFDAADYLASEMSRRTNGAVEITIFGGSQLGTDLSTFDDMRLGTIDMVMGGVTAIANFVPETAILGLPYFYSNMDQFRKVMVPGGEIEKAYQKIFDDKKLGVKLLALGGGGVRVLSNNQRDVYKPADLKGMKMRVPNSPDDVKLWGAMGAVVTSMAWGEIYSAVQAGVINAFESTIASYSGSKLYEVAKHISNTRHAIMPSWLGMSEVSWNKLPPQYQKDLVEVCLGVGRIFTDAGEKYDIELLKEAEKYGVKVVEVDGAAFMAIAQPMQDDIAQKLKMTDMVAQMRRLRDKK
jgi:tripartite ATP-independent transporter DctP family solute receptor